MQIILKILKLTALLFQRRWNIRPVPYSHYSDAENIAYEYASITFFVSCCNSIFTIYYNRNTQAV